MALILLLLTVVFGLLEVFEVERELVFLRLDRPEGCRLRAEFILGSFGTHGRGKEEGGVGRVGFSGDVQDEVKEKVGVRVWGDCKAIFFQLLYCNAKTTALVWNKRS